MYSDYDKKIELMRRRSVRKTRIACFIGASLLHFAASAILLALQTSCAFPRCIEGVRFEIFRAVMHVPLFLTPWFSLPSPDLDYVLDPMLGVWLALNAVLAVALYWGAAIAVYRGYRCWMAWKWEQLKAAQRAR